MNSYPAIWQGLLLKASNILMMLHYCTLGSKTEASGCLAFQAVLCAGQLLARVRGRCLRSRCVLGVGIVRVVISTGETCKFQERHRQKQETEKQRFVCTQRWRNCQGAIQENACRTSARSACVKY